MYVFFFIIHFYQILNIVKAVLVRITGSVPILSETTTAHAQQGGQENIVKKACLTLHDIHFYSFPSIQNANMFLCDVTLAKATS